MPISEGDFLDAMQTLVFGNSLTSTYKLALIRAIVEIVSESAPRANGADLKITYDELADAFLRMYWTQGEVYEATSGEQGVLAQNPANSLLILSLISDFKTETARYPEAKTSKTLTWYQASRLPQYAGLRKNCVQRVLIKNPLTYIKGYEFLFRNERAAGAVFVTGAVARYVCRFYPFLMELTESRWEAEVRSLKKNEGLLGDKNGRTLRDFLFHAQERESLEAVRTFMAEKLGEATCFYCGATLRKGASHADHFIPFSFYQDTKVFNFVPACASCNTSKSNFLASGEHVENWMKRNREKAEFIIRTCPNQLDPGTAVTGNRAFTVYQRADERKELLWVRRSDKAGIGPYMGRASQGLISDLRRYAAEMTALERRLASDTETAPRIG